MPGNRFFLLLFIHNNSGIIVVVLDADGGGMYPTLPTMPLACHHPGIHLLKHFSSQFSRCLIRPALASSLKPLAFFPGTGDPPMVFQMVLCTSFFAKKKKIKKGFCIVASNQTYPCCKTSVIMVKDNFETNHYNFGFRKREAQHKF